MGEFSETSMPEQDFSTDIPDSEPVADIVEESPPDVEPTQEIVEEAPADLEPVAETVVDSSFDNEPVEEETADDIVDESLVVEPNLDTGFDVGPVTETVEDVIPRADMSAEEPFEASPEIPPEMDVSPEPTGITRYDDGTADEQTFKGPEQTELYHSPETTREIEPGVGPNPSWDQPPDGSLDDHFLRETIDEDGEAPLAETDEGQISATEEIETGPDEMADQSEGSVSDPADEGVVIEEVPPETVDTLPATEQTSLQQEGAPEQSTVSQAEQEAIQKNFLDGKEVTLPGEKEVEYRIGSPHEDYEDYKGIVDANRQYDLAYAAQTSDSLGEVVGTVVAASQDGTDFTKEDEYFYGKYGRDAYTEAAYPKTNDDASVPSDSVDNLASAAISDKPDTEGSVPESTADVQNDATMQPVSDMAEASDETNQAIEKTIENAKGVEQLVPEEEVKVDKLHADTLYERNGYYYRTDEYGRPSGVYAELKLMDGNRSDEQTKVGHLGIEDDEGGHLIGTRFNGPTDAFNLVPQNMNLNRGFWKSMENDWATELEMGNDVRVEIEPTYGETDSKRPDLFLVNYTVTNKETGESTPYQRVFFNQSYKELAR